MGPPPLLTSHHLTTHTRCRIYVAATKVDLVGGRAGRAVDYHDTTDYCGAIGAQLFEVRHGTTWRHHCTSPHLTSHLHLATSNHPPPDFEQG